MCHHVVVVFWPTVQRKEKRNKKTNERKKKKSWWMDAVVEKKKICIQCTVRVHLIPIKPRNRLTAVAKKERRRMSIVNATNVFFFQVKSMGASEQWQGTGRGVEREGKQLRAASTVNNTSLGPSTTHRPCIAIAIAITLVRQATK